ncbi:MAG: hypothetical protein HY204_06000 [Nitrospirae bacterium]|nr:hypothetical protein [Nitrospirota bacterium]
MRLRLGLIIGLLLMPLSAAGAGLPNGHDRAGWGITLAELQNQVDVARVDMAEGFGYAEHFEEDPDVYYRVTSQHERVEYYFYQGRLYKIFIIYDRIYFHTPFYENLVKATKKSYGAPHDTYQEDLFGMPIQHTRWEDAVSVLDLRKGAGFIYQVRIDKAAAQKKAKAQTRKKSI